MNYYNEHDSFAAEWLRQLMFAGEIPWGWVDERDIQEVRPAELVGYTQCHFFAGIGGWSYALRLAGWPDDRPVWTGSPPCQPFSVAGKQLGKHDERHLWPTFFNLIHECCPPVVFGEQVASAIRAGWFDDLQNDLASEDYATGMVVLPACSVRAPHIRQRLFFVAERLGNSNNEGPQRWAGVPECEDRFAVGSGSVVDGLEYTGSERRSRRETSAPGHHDGRQTPERAQGDHGSGEPGAHRVRPEPVRADHGGWGTTDWLFCRDGKWRPVESINVEMADGIPDRLGYVRTGENTWSLNPLIKKGFSRVGRLKAYGNAIVPQVAAEVIKAFMDYENR